MSKVNGLFMDECDSRGEALITAGMSPDEAHEVVFGDRRRPQSPPPESLTRDAILHNGDGKP